MFYSLVEAFVSFRSNFEANKVVKFNTDCCGSLLELLSRLEITVCDVCESFLLNKGALVAQINDLHF